MRVLPRRDSARTATACLLAGALSAAVLAAAGSAPAGASAAPAPPTCTSKSTTASNTTPVAVPTGPGVVTSTIDVAGAGKYLSDVDVLTGLKHSFSADLDVTVTSPAGTVVTLTTDNGAGNDNVFDGTRWDDDANPAGQVPYTTNDGMVTDQAYVNLTPVPTLTPEEPLAAFVGENPNGTWTLTVSDDLAGDGGSLDSWSLVVETLPAAPNVVTTSSAGNATAVPIPTGPGVVTSTIDVAGAGSYLSDLDVTAGLQHTFSADLDVTVTSPAGTVVTLTTDNGAGNDNVFDGTRWDDDANPAGQVPYTTNNGMVTEQAYVNLTPVPTLTPEEPLGAFIGENPNGTWTLTVSDDLAGDGGNLSGWSLAATSSRCDLAVTGAGASVKGKQKVGKKLGIAATVAATSEKLNVAVSGSVNVPSKGKRGVAARSKTFGLAPQTRSLASGASAALKLALAGSKKKAAKALAAVRAALDGRKKVVATLTFTFTDDLGNTQTLTRQVRLKR